MNDTYHLSRGLVNGLILSCLTAIISIGGYMVVWNSSDKAWKARVTEKLEVMTSSIAKIETKVDHGILPEAAWRIDQIEQWTDGHERSHSRASE